MIFFNISFALNNFFLYYRFCFYNIRYDYDDNLLDCDNLDDLE